MWIYDENSISSHADLHPDCTAIVYLIHYEGGKKYIGKKQVRAVRRKKPTKAQLAIRKNFVRKEITDLPFMNYEGSLDKSECPAIVKKEILYQCSDKRTASYLEASLLFQLEALFSNEYLNKNISGTYFDNALDGLIKDSPETRG